MGGIPTTELNNLELEFLFMINFTLNVTPDVYMCVRERRAVAPPMQHRTQDAGVRVTCTSCCQAMRAQPSSRSCSAVLPRASRASASPRRAQTIRA